MNTQVICICLVHAAIDTAGAYWTRCSSVLSCVGGIDRVQAMPGHAVMAGMSGNHVHSVVEGW